MARVNQDLLRRITKTLDVSERRAYELIAAKAGESHLPRHLAAVALAAQHGINVSRRSYATDEERAQLRSATSGSGLTSPPAPSATPAPQPSRRRTGNRNSRIPQRKSNSVMVVYGRNLQLRDELFAFLRAIGLQPIEWTQAVTATRKGAPFVGEVLNAAFRKAAAVVVLLTPDDEARLKKKFLQPRDAAFERNLTGQPRPNVIFEAGRAFGSHPDSTILVQVGDVRPFSDTAGMHVVHLSNAADPRRDLASRLEAAGCAVDISGTDWLRVGKFEL